MSWPIAVSSLGPVSVGSLLWRRRGRSRISAIVKCTFSMIHGGFAASTAARPIHREERAWLGHRGGSPEIVPEVWPELRRPEVYLTGAAIAPNREALRALAVRLVVWKNHARLDKTLHVFGDRSALDRAPLPFSALPLVWERSPRGENGTNPAGVKDTPAGIIDPRRPGEPAGFGPRSIDWPGRELRAHLNGHLPLSTAWEWPDSLSPEAFGSAPLDQRVDTLDGDEWLIMDGMHADLPRFATRLPKPIGSAHLRDETGRREPFPMALDTIAIDMNALEVSLVFRGSLALLREHFADLVVEGDVELSEPERLLPVGATHPNGRLAAGLGKGMRLGSEPPPENVAAAAPAVPPVAVPLAIVPPAMVLPPVAAVPALPLGPPTALAPLVPEPPPSLARMGLGSLGTRMELSPPRQSTGALSAVIDEPSTAPVPDDVAKPENKTAGQPTGLPFNGPPAAPVVTAVASAPTPEPPAALAPTDAPAAIPAAPPVAAPLPAAPEPAAESGVRASLMAKLAAKQPLSDLPLAGADLTNLDLRGAVLSGLNLAGAKLAGAKLAGARMTGTKLPGADLTGADLSGADLTQADLGRANLASANLEDATLLDANLTSSEGKGARFDRARAQRALFAQGKWPETSFVGADLSGADLSGSELSGCKLDKSTLAGARFVDARAVSLSAVEADLSDANLAGVTFTEARFERARAPRTVWDRAVLDGSSFKAAVLDGAGFARAHVDRTDFSDCSLVKASLMGVSGEAAVFTSANLDSVDLRQGKLPEAKLDGAKLCKVNALKVTLSQASLVGADLTGASLRSAKLKSASLASAVLRDCDLRDADLEGADLRGADRQGAKLAGASLKGAQEGE